MQRTIESLQEELNLIRDEEVREWTKETLKNAPEYFWVAQASSSGKYHPACTCKDGGLITHVKRVVYLANRLCEGWGIFDIDRDTVLSACILHDIAKTPTPRIAYKYGMKTTSEDYTNHPLNVMKYYPGKKTITMNSKILGNIHQCIAYHMGRWTPDSIKKEIKDYDLLELIVYTCDYLATTKTLITPVDEK
jgi:HD superfamily phosphohydrolase YqeK